MALSNEPTLPSGEDDEGPETGQLGRYTLLGRLGVGGMGVVLAAHDPSLDRKVAIKLLWPSASGVHAEGETRLEREAQAMARLAHPNVVTVFEVDRVGDRVYVAMELVEGATLRDWLGERPRSWREIVDVFVAAGRGLAAAHAAGLVHRDFKPDNVLIGADGRPRVSDFGLVAETGDDRANATTSGTTARPTGTPAYMSPEQWSGAAVDARSDQFAFCVALLEALWGQRPFAATEVTELRTAVLAGAIVAPVAAPRVPRRLIAATRRGLAVDPAARWPDMATLLDELVRTTQRRRRWTIAALAAGIAIGSVGAASLVVATRETHAACAAPTARIGAVWSPVREAVMRVRLGAIDPAAGAVRADRIAAVFDAGAGNWSAMHVEACRATRIEGRQSDALLDARMACLDRWLVELGDTAAVIEQARTPTAVDQGMHAATTLSPLEPCADLRALGEALPPPASPADRMAAAALTRRAQELDVDQRAGRLEGLLAKTGGLVTEARTLGYAPAIVAALAVHARVEFAVGDKAASEPTLRDLAQFAARAKDDRAAAFAWSNLYQTLGVDLGKQDLAEGLLQTASAAVLRAGDPADLRGALLYSQAIALDYGGHPADGLALLTQARALYEKAGGTDPTSPLAPKLADMVFESGTAQAFVGNTTAAIAAYHDAIERWRAIYGPDSPDEAFGWQNLGAVLELAARNNEALVAFRTAARIREARMGESPMVAISLMGVANVLGDLGRWDEALATDERALHIQRAQLGPDDLAAAGILIARGLAQMHLDRLDEAQRSFDEAIALYDKGGNTHDLPTALYNRAELSAKRGHCDVAMRDYARSVAHFEKLVSDTQHELLFPLVGEAACLVRTGHPADAFAPLARALAVHADTSDAAMVARAHYYLGRARVETRRDVAGGLAMVRAARAGLASRPDDVVELDRWLAGQPN